jgi:hypothetical protein
VQKRGKERGKPWWANAPWLLLSFVGLISIYLFFSREPPGLTLKYGELKQILQDPGISFQNVKLDSTDIRGEIVTRAPITDGENNGVYQSKPKAFHVSRRGLENDPALLELLHKWVGANYQGAEDESA